MSIKPGTFLKVILRCKPRDVISMLLQYLRCFDLRNGKFISENATSADRQHFLEELKTMTLHGSHPNLVNILGACQHEGKNTLNPS